MIKRGVYHGRTKNNVRKDKDFIKYWEESYAPLTKMLGNTYNNCYHSEWSMVPR